MSNILRLSIITVNYENLDGLRNTVTSVLSQTDNNFEFIIVDGGSKDGTHDLLASYEVDFAQKGIAYHWISETDNGIYHAMNKGVALAGGDYCNFMNSGDCFASNSVLEDVFSSLTWSPDIIIGKAKTATRTINPPKNPTLEFFYFKRSLNHQAAFIKRSLLKKYPYDEVNYKIVSDWKFFLEAFLIEQCSYMSIDTLVVLFDSDGIGSQNIRQNRREQDHILKNYFNERILSDIETLRFNQYKLVRFSQRMISKYVRLRRFLSLKTYDNNLRLSKPVTKALLCRRMLHSLLNQIDISLHVGNRLKEYGLTTEVRPIPLIVSLTSYPARLETLADAVISLLTQSVKPNKLILWLTSSQFPRREADVPQAILDLQKFGLTISWCDKPIKSYTKLVPTLELYPKAIVVVADDDIFYRKNWLEGLYRAYLGDTSSIHCYKSHSITLVEGRLIPYNNWSEGRGCSFNNLLMGVGGVLYPPNSLYSDVTDDKRFMALAPNADDLWFWAMAVLNKTRINVIHSKNSKVIPIPNVNNEDALFNLNSTGGNDLQIESIMNEYASLKKLLE